MLDFAHRVEHRGVVAPAEAPADFRQRPQRHGLGEIHRDLARADHVGGPAGRQKVAPADVITARDDPLDVLDLDLALVERADQVADFPLGQFQRHLRAGQRAGGQAVG